MWIKIKPRTYDAYADVYDELKGDRSSTIKLVVDLIKKHRPGAHSVLDVACGTGGIGEGLVRHGFDVTGLDRSPHMLRVATHKVPGAHFVQGDMTSFTLNRQFDVVCCLHNSVNHLVAFADWEALFHNVAKHLPIGGLFIFDVNPVAKMEHMATMSPSLQQIRDGYVIIQVVRDANKGSAYTWDVKIVRKKKSGYAVQHEPIKVSAYPEDKILTALQRNFAVASSFTPAAPNIIDDVDRVYYVCQKIVN